MITYSTMEMKSKVFPTIQFSIKPKFFLNLFFFLFSFYLEKLKINFRKGKIKKIKKDKIVFLIKTRTIFYNIPYFSLLLRKN